MAESFARRMMAQRLMTDARATPFSDSAGFGGRSTPDSLIRAVPDAVDASLANEAADLGRVAYGGAAMGSLFLPGAGVTDVMGYAPDPFNQGEYLPSFGENVAQGNYLDAGLQTLGVAGDVLQAGGAIVPPLAAVGTALKTPRAYRVAGQAADVAADATKVDPNQAAGAAMDAAQARYFETGQFEPPTAENPVSVVRPTETEPGIIAFHGSGADFDEFRLEMIGTGEGAQAYGYGLYFTDSEDIAKFYKDALGSENLVLPSGQTVRTMNIGDMAVVEDALPSELERLGVINQAPDGTARYNKPSVLIAEAIGEAGSDDLVGNTRKYLETKLETESSFERQRLGFTKAEGDALEQANIDALAAFDKMIEAGIETKTGKMYKVALSPKPDELLDHDAPFSQQSKDVQEKLIKAGYELDPRTSGSGNMIVESIMSNIAKARLAGRDESLKNINARLGELAKEMDKYSSGYRNFNDPRGQVLADEYDALLVERENLPTMTMSEARKLASQELAKAGIPGIKYRAAGSRGAATADEAAERNYVIFDDKAVKILEKYGIAGPVLVTGAVVGASKAGNDNENGGSILPDAGVL
jgi:hypothetical protein